MPVPPNALPPINVVVQNPPGMSEWIKTLLSASVGFVFAMIASLVMEYIKPILERSRLRANVKKQLHTEFIQNMIVVDGLVRFLDMPKRKTPTEQIEADDWARSLLSEFRRDRFDQLFEESKDVVYELDPTGHLVRFYERFKGRKTDGLDKIWLNGAQSLGDSYAKYAKLQKSDKRHPIERVREDLEEAEEHGRRDALP
jgi:hypothetical protein